MDKLTGSLNGSLSSQGNNIDSIEEKPNLGFVIISFALIISEGQIVSTGSSVSSDFHEDCLRIGILIKQKESF